MWRKPESLYFDVSLTSQQNELMSYLRFCNVTTYTAAPEHNILTYTTQKATAGHDSKPFAFIFNSSASVTAILTGGKDSLKFNTNDVLRTFMPYLFFLSFITSACLSPLQDL